jgi:hypothetical protein
MDVNPDREYTIYQTRHIADIKRAEQQRLSLSAHRKPANRYVCRVLCGLGHKLVRWGQYLEQHFALPDMPAQEPEPSAAPRT